MFGYIVVDEYAWFGPEDPIKRIVVLLACLFVVCANSAFAETQTLIFTNFDELSVAGGMRVSIVGPVAVF